MSLLDALLGDKGVIVKFKADLTNLQAGIAQAKTDLTGWRDETNAHSKDMAKWAAAAGAYIVPIAAAGAAAYASVEKYGAMAAEIGDLAYTTGMSTEKIQQLQYAATLSNTAFSSVTMGVNTLTLAIAKAGDTSSDAGKAFAALGVSTAGKSPDQIFEETAVALAGMKNETQRNEIAMTLYGRSWKEMLPFMEDYVKNREKIQKSPTFSAQELQDLKDAKAAWDGLNSSITIYSGKVLAFVEKSFSSDSIESVMTLDRAYRKLFTGDIKGYLDEAAAYHDKQVEKETQKMKDVIESSNKNTSTTGAWANPLAPGGASSIDSTTDALKNLETAFDNVADAQRDLISEQGKLRDLNKDYARDLQQLDPNDVQGFINLKQRHEWANQDQLGTITKAQDKVTAAAGATVPGVSFAGATINVTGDKSFDKMIQDARIRAGVRSN